MSRDNPGEICGACRFWRGQNADHGYAPELVTCAIHESGHAVAAQALGGAVYAATLQRGSEPSGSEWVTTGGAVSGWVANGRGVEACRRRMVFLAAGVCAQVIFDPLVKTARQTDQDKMEDEAWVIVGRRSPWQDVDQEIERARASAALVLRQNWDHVEAVALALLRFHRVIDRIPVVGFGAE